MWYVCENTVMVKSRLRYFEGFTLLRSPHSRARKMDFLRASLVTEWLYRVYSYSVFKIGTVPGECESSNSRNRGPSEGPQDTKWRFGQKEKVLMILIIFRQFMQTTSAIKTAWTLYSGTKACALGARTSKYRFCRNRRYWSDGLIFGLYPGTVNRPI